MTKEEIKNKIADLYVPCKPSDYKTEEDFNIANDARNELIFAAEFGYSISEEQLKEKQWQIDELIRTTGNAQDTLLKRISEKDKEIHYLQLQIQDLQEQINKR